MLCQHCRTKLDSGEINELEIDVSRYLFDLSKRINTLRGIKIRKIMNCGVLLIVTDRGSAAKLVGRNGSIVKKIAKKFKKSIRILEEAPDFRDFAEGLISPVSISGINTVYKDDKEIYKLRLPSFKKDSLMIAPENLSIILSKFYNIDAEIVFE